MSRVHIEIYRWSDGSTVRLVVRRKLQEVRLSIEMKGSPFGDTNIWLEPRTELTGRTCLWALELEEDNITEFSAKIVGLALDLGAVPISSQVAGLVRVKGSYRSCALYPRWVPNRMWADRYHLARTEISADAICPGVNLKIWRDEPTTGPWTNSWTGTWNSDNRSSGLQLGSFESLVDMALRDNVVMPESARPRWEAEHIKRGEFVGPFADQVEVLRLLGEPLPLFWPYAAVEPWVREMGGS